MSKNFKPELKLLFILFIFKIFIITFLPLTGDEAYFIKWGNNLSMGYYDHPPMIGWIIYILNLFSDKLPFYRLFSVVTTFITAFVIYKIAILYKVKKDKALYVALIFLSSPIDILISLITNDIPLLLFGSIGTLLFVYSLEKKEWIRYSIFGGIFLGFAFLSKYFAVFLMLSLVAFSLRVYKTRAIKNILLVTFITSLFILQNLYFNYNSCWNNIIFNFFVRTGHSDYHLKSVIIYFILIIYLFTPWGIYYLFKSKFNSSTLLKLIVSILSFAFLIFFIVSLKKNVGLHWFLLFIPYMFLLFSFVDDNILKKIFKYNIIFTFIHITILLVAILLPKSLLKNNKKYSDIIVYTQPQKLCKTLNSLNDKQVFALGYSSASILSYTCKKDIKVLFNNSKYGRLDDKLLDVRTLSGKDILIFNSQIIKKEKIKDICGSFSTKKVKISDANFYIGECKNFNYLKYKKYYLDIQKEKFYKIPKFLPIGKCYFYDRYYR